MFMDNLQRELDAEAWLFDTLEEEDEYEDEDFGYESNMPCDTYGPLACTPNCSNWQKCNGKQQQTTSSGDTLPRYHLFPAIR